MDNHIYFNGKLEKEEIDIQLSQLSERYCKNIQYKHNEEVKRVTEMLKKHLRYFSEHGASKINFECSDYAMIAIISFYKEVLFTYEDIGILSSLLKVEVNAINFGGSEDGAVTMTYCFKELKKRV